MGSIKRYYAIAVTLGFVLCLLASLRFNVWPAYKSGDYAAAVTMAAFVVLMAVIGVVLPHARGLRQWIAGLIAIGALLSVNYYVSLRTNAHEQRVAVADMRSKFEQSQDKNNQITKLKGERDKLKGADFAGRKKFNDEISRIERERDNIGVVLDPAHPDEAAQILAPTLGIDEARLNRIFNLYLPAVADCISFTAPSSVVLFIDMIFGFFWPGWREEEEARTALRKTQGMQAAVEEERHKVAAPLTQSAAQPAKPRGKSASSESTVSAADLADEMRESRVVVPLRRAVKPTLSEVEALKQRGMSNRKIAALYGVDESTIRRVLKGSRDAANAATAAA